MTTSRPPHLDDRTVERLLAGGSGPAEPDLQQVVRLLRATASGPAPRPSAALAELLDGGFEPQVVPLRRPAVRRTWVLRAAAGLTAAAASVLVAGTAQALPAPLQDGLGDLVSAVTPFELPGARPVDHPSSRVPARGTGTTTPEEPAPTPSPSAPGNGSPVPGAGADPSAPGAPADAATTDGGTEARSRAGTPARTAVPDGPRPPAAPEQSRAESRRAVPEAPPSQREAAPPSAPRGSTVPPDPAGTGQRRAGSPADASAARETRGSADDGR